MRAGKWAGVLRSKEGQYARREDTDHNERSHEEGLNHPRFKIAAISYNQVSTYSPIYKLCLGTSQRPGELTFHATVGSTNGQAKNNSQNSDCLFWKGVETSFHSANSVFKTIVY